MTDYELHGLLAPLKGELNQRSENGNVTPLITDAVILLLKYIEADGETLEYILEELGMDEQLAKQLLLKYQRRFGLGLLNLDSLR